MASEQLSLMMQAKLDKIKSAKSVEEGMRALQDSLDSKNITKIKIRYETDTAGKMNKAMVQVEDKLGKTTQTAFKMGKTVDGVAGKLEKTTKVTEKTAEAMKKAKKESGGLAKSMGAAAKSAINYALGLGLIYKALAEIGKGVQFIKDLDVEMRNIQIVAGYTDEEISSLAVSYNELAKAMGATTLEVAAGSLEWTRQGKSITETQELLKSTLMLSKLGNVDTAQSTEYLTSILNGFKLEAKDTESVVSKLVAVDNAAATSVEELATAMQKSSVSAQAAGVDFDTLVAYIGTVSSITRLSAQTVGTSFKTMFARFQDIKEGALDGEGAINNVESALGRVTLASGEQMSIMNRQTGEFKDFSVVVEQLAGEWESLTEMEQANIVKAFAGVRQRESFLALMENQEMMHNLLGEAMDSEGLAADRYAIYLEGLEAAQNKATAAWEGMIAASVDGGLVKWFYDAQAGLFGFIEAFGGLDTLLAGISAGLVTYGVGMLSAEVATGGLALAWKALTVAIEANPLGILAVAIAAVTVAAIDLNNEIKKAEQGVADNWTAEMEKVAASTDDAGEILDAFSRKMEAVNGVIDDSGTIALAFIDETKLIEDGLKAILPILERSTDGWTEYKESIDEAAEIAGYSIDEFGKLYKERADGFRMYDIGLETITYSQYTAGAAAEQLAEQIGMVGTATESSDRKITELTETFQGMLKATSDLAAGDTGIGKVVNDFTELNRLFQEGLYTADEYFEQMEEGISSLDMTETFAGNDEAALQFFSGLSVNAVESISAINAEWENGEVSFTTYLENLSGATEMLSNLGEMASGFFGENEQAAEGMNLLSEATAELNQRLEVNAITRDTLRQVVEQELQFGTEAYNEAMQMQAKVMANSGIVYTNAKGEAMKSANEIYGYLVKTDGNMQKLASQTANQTQITMKNAAVGAAKLLNGLADMIDGFSATISFTPRITGGITLDALGLHLPSVEMAIAGGGVGDFIRSAASQLENWTPEPVDASVYTQGAGDVDFGGSSGDAEEYADTVGSVSNALRELAKESGKTTTQLEEDAKSIDALLDMVVKKIKQEQKARKEALKEQLAGYKSLIDKRKDLLDTMQDEVEYQRKLEDNQRELSTVQSELAEIALDDSEEAAARRRALEEEEAEIKEEIEENEANRSVELQKEALDNEYETFKMFIDSQISAIDDYLASNGAIVGDALSLIGEKGESLYSDLSNWNAEYGSGIQQDVVTAWDDAYLAISRYAGGLAAITGNAISMPSVASSAAAAPSFTADMGLDTSNLVESNLSSMTGNTGAVSNQGGAMSIENLIELNVAGNLDSSVMPEIDKIANLAVEKINEIMRDRGFGQRSAGQYST